MASPSDTLPIIRRFYDSIAILKSERKISGLKDYCEKNGLNVTRYYELQNLIKGKETRYKSLEVDALYTLAANYNFSLQWLFFGVGEPRVSPKPVAKCKPSQIEIVKISYKDNA